MDQFDTYEIARVEVQLYRKGARLTGRNNIRFFYSPPPGCIWYPYDQHPNMAYINDDTATFVMDAALVRIDAIGLTADGISNGDIAFRLITEGIDDIFGEQIKQFVDRAYAEAQWRNDFSVSAYITVVSFNDTEKDVKYRFEGFLPMDTRLLHIVQENQEGGF